MLLGIEAHGGVDKVFPNLVPDFDKHKWGITHLFMDSAGCYNSQKPDCVLTGAFFWEPDRENADIWDMILYLKKITAGRPEWASIMSKVEENRKIDSEFKELYMKVFHLDYRL